MAEFQVRNPPGLNESTNGIIPHLNASSFPVSGLVSVPIRVPAAASVAAVVVTRPKWIDIYDEMFGSNDVGMDESVDYRGDSNKKKKSKPNAAKSGSSTRPVVSLSDQSDEKPGALDEPKLQAVIRKYSPDNLEILLDNLPAYFKKYFGYDFSLKGKLIDFFETTRFPSIEVVKRNQRTYIKLVREMKKTDIIIIDDDDDDNNDNNSSSKASVSTNVILQHKPFLKRNKRLVINRKSRPIVKHKACAQTISSENDTVASSIVAIKEENKASKKRKRKGEDISQAKKSIKTITDPSPPKMEISLTLSYTEKQRIRNILQTFITKNVRQIDYYDFRKTYRNKYGERLNVEGTIVREFIKTISPWQVKERRKKKSVGRDRMCYDLENQNMTDINQLSKGDKQKSNKSTSSLPHTKVSTSVRYEQRDLISPASTPITIPSNDWASSEDDTVASSIVAIKEETNVSSSKRKSEDISQAKNSVKTKTDPSSSTLSSTEKKRIQNMLQTLAADNVFRIDYYDFRKTYQQKYGEMLNVEGTIVREFMNMIPPWQVTRGNGVGRIYHYYLVNQNMTVTHEKFKGDNHFSNNHISSTPYSTKISTTRSSTATTHENSSVSRPNDSRITTLLEKQMDLSQKILEGQLKKNKLDEKDVLLSDQLLVAQLKNNELDEECNLILLLNSKNEGAGKRNGE